jgi:hypothetical protein
LSRTYFLNGTRALQSRILNKQTIPEKIPSLFAFLASVSRMRRADFVCTFMQTLRAKMKMKYIPGPSGDNNSCESNRAAEESIYGKNDLTVAHRRRSPTEMMFDTERCAGRQGFMSAPGETGQLLFSGLS